MLHRIDSICQVSGLPASESNFLGTLVTHAYALQTKVNAAAQAAMMLACR